jgi:exodeoxyribonuclease VIII
MNEKFNVMLDLETLGTTPGSVILSIGAVSFDENGLGNEFYCTIDAQSAISSGLTVSGDTFKWWMGQKAEARKALFERTVSIHKALDNFADWLEAEGDPKQIRVWGNGSDFDNTILAKAYEVVQGRPTPWAFWNNRCYRTVCSVMNAKQRKQEGVPHNALDDAKSQANHLVQLFKARAVW